MSEFGASIFCDLLLETKLIPRTLRAFRRQGVDRRVAWDYMRLRLFAKEKYDLEVPIWVTPQRFPLFNRREIILYRELFLFDDYESHLWRQDLAEAKMPTVLDVGANVGLFAMLCLGFNPNCRMRCVEMIPDCKSIIERRLRGFGCRDFRVVTAAVGNGDGGSIEVHYDSPYSMGNSLQRRVGDHSVVVPTSSLDGMWEEGGAESKELPFLVKIDVEGAERAVVEGGMKNLSSSRFVLLELHDSEEADLPNKLRGTHDLVSRCQKSKDFSVCVLRRR